MTEARRPGWSGRKTTHSVGSMNVGHTGPTFRTVAQGGGHQGAKEPNAGRAGAEWRRERRVVQAPAGLQQPSLLTRAALRPKPEEAGGRPHVILLASGDLEASGGWNGKWGKGQSVAPAVASLQDRWVGRLAASQTRHPQAALGWLSAAQEGGHATSRRPGLHLLCWRAGRRRPQGCCCL